MHLRLTWLVLVNLSTVGGTVAGHVTGAVRTAFRHTNFHELLHDNCIELCDHKKKKDCTSFGQPTRLIACANYGQLVKCS